MNETPVQIAQTSGFEVSKQRKRMGIAIADIIYQCEREKISNLDTNLMNITC